MRSRIATVLLCLTALFLLIGVANAGDITDKCRFRVSHGSAKNITDASMKSCWSPGGAKGEVQIALPETPARYILIEWGLPPQNCVLEQCDAEGNVLEKHESGDDGFACISDLHEIVEGAALIKLSFEQKKQVIHAIRVYGEGELPATVVKWEPPVEKADLMLVSAHQDDEWLWFGGLIPYYDRVKDLNVQVVYMTNGGRMRYAEALNSLAVAGMRNFPVFLGLADARPGNMQTGLNQWGGAKGFTETMTALIRRFKPEVLVTHDWNGEYKHIQHIMTTRFMDKILEAAADESVCPENAAEYGGAWQVKKFYRHLWKENKLRFNWKEAYEALGGQTPLEVARLAFKEHVSQNRNWKVDDGGKFDNAAFGLCSSTVGDDVLHEDLFENIPGYEAADPTSEPTAAPTPEPTVEPTEKPTPKPTEEPLPEEDFGEGDFDEGDFDEGSFVEESFDGYEPEDEAETEPGDEEARPGMAIWILVIAILAGAAGICFIAVKKRRERLRRKKRRAAAKKRKKAQAKKRET